MSVTEIKDSERSFTFNRKLLFTASQNVITSRSRIHKLLLPKPAARHRDLWEIKPPDFSPKLYCTLNLPRIKKKTLDSAILKEGLEELSQSLDIMPPVLQSKQEKNRNIPVFVKSYKPPALLDLQLKFVKFGQFPRDPYKNPKPHNFRPVSLQQACTSQYVVYIVTNSLLTTDETSVPLHFFLLLWLHKCAGVSLSQLKWLVGVCIRLEQL